MVLFILMSSFQLIVAEQRTVQHEQYFAVTHAKQYHNTAYPPALRLFHPFVLLIELFYELRSYHFPLLPT